MSDSSRQPPAADDPTERGVGGERPASDRPGPPPADAQAGNFSRRVLWTDDTEEISFAAVLTVLLRHRRLIACLPLAVAFVWAIIVLVLPRKYTSEAIFTPSSGTAQLSQLAGLAAQFGVTVPQGETNESPAFYADLLQSRELLRSAVETTYRFPRSGGAGADTLSGDLVTLFGIGGADRPRQIDKAIDKLSGRLSVSADATTGLVTVDVTTRWAALSREVGERLLALVNSFNLQTRQTQASAERRFLQGRVATVRDSLRTAENTLQSFLEHNRSYQSSPELQFEYDRLNNRVTLQQQVYTTLAQSLEQAKIDQVRNTPVITVVEAPELPARPDHRHVILKVILGIVLGFIVAIVWAFGSEWRRRAQRGEPADYQELGAEWNATKKDLRQFWGGMRRRGSR